MKKRLFEKSLLLLVVLQFSFLARPSFAQGFWKSDQMKSYFYLQPNIGISQYFGDLNEKDYWSQTPQFGAGLIGGFQKSPILGFRAQFVKTVIFSEKKGLNRQLISDLWDGALHVTFNINDIFTSYNDKRLLNFYLLTGAALSSFKSYLEIQDPHLPLQKHDHRQYNFVLPVGAGGSVRVSNAISLNFEYTDRTVFNSTILDFTDGGKSNNDHYSYASAGVQVKLGAKDTDGDGVRDKDDLCPTVFGKKSLAGCPDKDNDGIADKDDACPDVAGVAEFKGCPDTDGDGIPDKDDLCPNAAGKKELKGCPDKDNDGVADKDDRCPDVAGKVELAGCPDRDGDGIADIDDSCPDVKGLAQFNGCPDTDGDGIPDNLDKCPDVPGVASNNGCPEVDTVALPVFEKKVYFKSDAFVIPQTIIADLDSVVTFVQTHPNSVVSVEGHADNRESDHYNLQLSEKRADFVVSYLEKKGVVATKVVKAFYGKSKPVADNSTAKGRALNRRVEITVTTKK